MPEFLYFRFFNLSGLIHSHWSCGGGRGEQYGEGGRKRRRGQRRGRRDNTHKHRGGGRGSSTNVKLVGTCLLLCLVCFGNLPECGRKVPNQVMAAIRIPVVTGHLKREKCSAEPLRWLDIHACKWFTRADPNLSSWVAAAECLTRDLKLHPSGVQSVLHHLKRESERDHLRGREREGGSLTSVRWTGVNEPSGFCLANSR